jgi:hypothetical protein
MCAPPLQHFGISTSLLVAAVSGEQRSSFLFPLSLVELVDGQHAEGRAGALDVLRADAGEGCR